MVKQLTDSGFQRITNWVLNKDRARLASLAWQDGSGWIYAFVTSGRVRYVGITERLLRSRMDNYRDLANDRVRSLIENSLAEGDLVEVYARRCTDLSRPEMEKEESWLMRLYGADWNVRG